MLFLIFFFPREYKSDILATNFHDAATTLIKRENFRLTIAFLFDNCFQDSYPEIHNIFRTIYKSCPSLVASLDHRYGESEESLNDTSELPLVGDASHMRPLALKRIIIAKSEVDSAMFVGVQFSKDLDDQHPFIVRLRNSYRQDYGVLAITHFGKNAFQWTQRVSFAPR